MNRLHSIVEVFGIRCDDEYPALVIFRIYVVIHANERRWNLHRRLARARTEDQNCQQKNYVFHAQRDCKAGAIR